MSTAWRVLDFLSYHGTLSYSRGQLAATDNDDSTTQVPLADVAVVLASDRTQLSGGLLHKLGDYGIALIICDWKHVPVAALSPWGNHGRVAARQRAQVELAKPRAKNAWAQIVQAKIIGQARTLEACERPDSNRLYDFARQVRSGDPDNREAHAARIYWPRLVNQDFRRDPNRDDEINAAFNYAYTVLRGHGIRAVAGAGLNPALGLHHRGRSNAFNLVDDLIEPFRPAIDYTVINVVNEIGFPCPEGKASLVEASTQPFSDESYSASTQLSHLAYRVGRYVEGELSRLKVDAWTGPA